MNSEDPGVSKADYYRYWTAVGLARCQLQHKCVEMSITVTAGLTAALFALMSKQDPPPKLFVVIFGLYAVIESLILANYIYHTFVVSIISSGLSGLTLHIDKPIAESTISEIHTAPKASQQLAATLTNCFQPLIIYGSIAIGWIAFAVYVSCIASSLSVYFSCLAFLLIMLFACSELWVLYRLHSTTERLAKYWCWIIVREKDRGILRTLRQYIFDQSTKNG